MENNLGRPFLSSIENGLFRIVQGCRMKQEIEGRGAVKQKGGYCREINECLALPQISIAEQDKLK